MKDWLLKIYRYDGSESVLGDFDTKEDAQKAADEMNRHEQTDTYRAERFRPSQMDWPHLPPRLSVI